MSTVVEVEVLAILATVVVHVVVELDVEVADQGCQVVELGKRWSSCYLANPRRCSGSPRETCQMESTEAVMCPWIQGLGNDKRGSIT